jgi:hypothetical protein
MLSRATTLVFVLACSAFCRQRFDVTTTDSFTLPAGGTVHVLGSTGEMNIEGWDQPTVEVQIDRYGWGNNEQNVKKSLEHIRISKQVSGNTLNIDTVHSHFGTAHVDCRIRVPRNMNLVIHHGTGDVTIYDVRGNIDASAKFGDVVLQLSGKGKYDIDAHTKFGTIYSDFAGLHHAPLSIGESLKPAPEGTGDVRQIRLHAGMGGITIQKVPDQPLLSLN